MRILGSLLMLCMLSACGCVSEAKDDADVSGYFSGCWSKLKNEKAQNPGQDKTQDSSKNSVN